MAAHKRIKSVFVHGILLILAVIMAFPFFYLLKLSLQPDADVMQLPIKFIPTKLMLSNFVGVLKQVPIGEQLTNTLIYAISTSVLTVFTGAFAAYALAKLYLPGARWLTLFFISTMLLPPEVRAIPMYTMMADLGWVDTWKGMILPLASTGFAIFFLYQYMITIPDEMMEAARIDGASEFQILWSIILPVSSTAIFTMGLYNFLFRWRGFIWPLVMTKGSVTTLPVGLSALKRSEFLLQWNLISAGTMFSFIPSLLIFLALRRYIMSAVAVEFK
ncbi:MAG: carbohydrate ABC transporter permease [bacterium]|nr:carbohydrate ABC transporter permease [bacterium]